jgi:hypothetical protein
VRKYRSINWGKYGVYCKTLCGEQGLYALSKLRVSPQPSWYMSTCYGNVNIKIESGKVI